MTVAEAFAGLVEFDPSLLGVDEEIMSIIPTFSSGDPRTTPRPDVIMFPRGSASAPTAKHIGTVQGIPMRVDDDQVAWWYGVLDSRLTSSVRYIPTFLFGRSGIKLYLDALTVRAFTSIRTPVAAAPDPVTDVAHFISYAHFIAKSQGYVAGTPSFLRDGDDWEILAFSPSQVRVGRGYDVGWTFQNLPVHTDALGIGVATEPSASVPTVEQLVVYTVPGEEVWQHRPGAASDVDVRVFPPAGQQQVPDRWQGPLPTMVSVSRRSDPMRVGFGDFAWMVAERPVASPTGFSLQTVSGRMPTDVHDRTSGIVAAQSAIAPSGLLLAAHQSLPVGRSVDTTWGEDVAGNLIVARPGAAPGTWDTQVIDGDADADGRMLGRPETMTVVSDGADHVFYSLRVPDGSGGTTLKLRHAMQRGSSPWVLETLDGSGQPTPPAVPGTGRTRASVGLNPTAALFDGKLWVVYEDLTYGNLRCAVGTFTGSGYDWTFSILDGSSGWRRTPHPVGLASMVAWEDRLSVFYVDIDRNVLRHASRVVGAAGWRFEVVDGAGGVGGRINAKVASVFAVAAGRDASGEPRRPLHAVYTLDYGSLPGTQLVHNVRVATIG